jgi:DNA-binding transcriptional regulator LsrR (DeoR family)/predicted XRE-type DNA-binding protein
MHNANWERGKSFGERFANYIKYKKFSQPEVARQLHTNQAHISRLIRGIRTPTYEDIVQMMTAWGRDVTMRLLFDNRRTSGGITWVEPWPVLSPSIQLDETTKSLGVFHEFMARETEASSANHLPQHTLLNSIKQCFLSGIVQIQDVARNEELEQALKDQYALADCIVADVSLPSDPVADTVVRAEAVAFLAARDAIYSALHSQHVGITGGSPIYRFVDLLLAATDRLRGIHWWSLLSTYNLVIGGAPAGTGANDTIARLAYSQPSAMCHPLPFIHAHQRDPLYRNRAVDPEREEIRFAETSLHGARQVQTAFLSVGSPDFEFRQLDITLRTPALRDVYDSLPKAERDACVGDILLRAVDGDGNILGDAEVYDRFVYSVSHDDLRQVVARGGMVWILAERPRKAAVVRAALESRLANAVVIDKSIAEQIVPENSTSDDADF